MKEKLTLRRITSKNIAPANERGSALVIALWVAMLISVIALELSTVTRFELRTLDYDRKRLQSRELARGAVERAIVKIGDPQWRGHDALTRYGDTGWFAVAANSGPKKLPEIAIENEDGKEIGAFSVEIADESGKLNINTCDERVLTRLFALRGMLSPAAAAAEIVRYRASRPNSRIFALDELRAIANFDAKMIYGEDTNNNGALDPEEDDGDNTAPPDNRDGRLATGIAAVLTASPVDEVSINAAPREVIAAALGIDSAELKEFELLKKSRGGTFSSLDELKVLGWMSNEKMETLRRIFTVDSGRFIVRAAGSAAGEKYRSGISASIAATSGGPVAVSWREN